MFNFGIVIDKQGFKVEFVVLNQDKTPQYYELKDGETIIEIDWQIANSMNKPQWNGEAWVETETLPPQEIEPQEPSKIEILEGKVTALEESQQVQDFLIDDLVFEVIPTLEQQIDLGTSPAQDVTGVLSNRLINKGGDGMAGYLARKIIDGRDYATVFKTNAYKQYQDEVDTILELEGRSDLINR